MKRYNEMMNVGRAKYVINHHDGVTTHPDGSPFYGVAIFKTRRDKDKFVRELRARGYLPDGETDDLDWLRSGSRREVHRAGGLS